MNKLLERDRLTWTLSALLYVALGLAVAIFAGPLTWDIRAGSGASAGTAAIQIGILSGVLLAGGLLSLIHI